MLETLQAMDPWVIAAFMGASVLLYLTPGIDMLFTFASGAAGGRKVGVVAGLGVSLGSLFHTAVAVLGVAALIQSSAHAYAVLKYGGALYLLYLAVVAWRAPAPMVAAAANRRWRLTRFTPKGSGATSRACPPTPGSFWGRWKSPKSTPSPG